MSTSYTVTETAAFTVTHAIHIAAKIAADLKRMQRLYGSPSDAAIASYESEIVALLKAGYLGTVTYGYWQNESWIEPTLRYTAQELVGVAANDDDPGRVRPGANITGATFYSYLTYSAAWDRLSGAEQSAFKPHGHPTSGARNGFGRRRHGQHDGRLHGGNVRDDGGPSAQGVLSGADGFPDSVLRTASRP